MSALTPKIADIRLSFDLISRSNYAVSMLPNDAFRALIQLVAQAASGLVWTYSAPGDGSIPDDDVVLARITCMTKRQWLGVRPSLEQFFAIGQGKWCLSENWIAVDDRPIRYAIPAKVQQLVLAREGKVCTYCGDEHGPFDYDHIFPVSRGGTNDPSNLTLACASCNRSKGAKTLREWAA